jgi:hypothetical protein
MDRKKTLPAAVLALAILASVGWWVWGANLNATAEEPMVPWTVEKATAFRHEIVYACGDREIRYQGQAPSELHGLTKAGVLERYPDTQGWSVFFDLPAELVVVEQPGTFCAEHAGYRHLGVYDGWVAVYEGPLGGGGQLRQVVELPLDSLPESWRRKLCQAAAFQAQPPEIQAELRREMEFSDEKDLYSALENLDEWRQD